MSFAKENMLQGEGTEPLKAVHREIVRLIDKKDFAGVAGLMKDFCDEDADPNRLRMILITTKSFKEHPELEEPRKKLLAFIENKLGYKLP